MQSATRWLRVGGTIQTDAGVIVHVLAIQRSNVQVKVVSPGQIEFGRLRESKPLETDNDIDFSQPSD